MSLYLEKRDSFHISHLKVVKRDHYRVPSYKRLSGFGLEVTALDLEITGFDPGLPGQRQCTCTDRSSFRFITPSSAWRRPTQLTPVYNRVWESAGIA